MLFFLITSLGLTALDFLAKRWAVMALAAGQEIVLISPILKLLYGENTGAAFGILPASRIFLILVGAAVVLGVLWYIKKERSRSRWQYHGLIFIFAGALGNLIDRVFYGYVIDFICLPYFPIFNLADIFINIGVLMLVVYLLKFSGKEQ